MIIKTCYVLFVRQAVGSILVKNDPTMIFAPFEFYKAVLEADLDSFDEQITPLSMKFKDRLMCVLDLVLNSSQDSKYQMI